MTIQQDALDTLVPLLQRDEAVRAIFLKGSMARQTHDAYSDVDLYCLIAAELLNDFLTRRSRILAQYRPVLYRADANFVGPQAVVIYDNGLHLDLYAVTLDALPATTPIRVLHDPYNLLTDYVPEPLSISQSEAVKHFNYFAFTLYEVYNAVQRGNEIWARFLCARMTHELAVLYRYRHYPDTAQPGIRHIDRLLDEPLQTQWLAAENAPVVDRVRLYADIMQGLLASLPDEIPFNRDFFAYMQARLSDLSDEPA